MQQLISCASYYGSGSSAVTDLIGEYDGVKSLSDYEFRFIQDIDGITDLEYHLVKNHHRHNAGHALKRFLKLSEFNHGTWFNKRYEPFFGGKYLEFTREYVNALTEFSFTGHWFMDMYDRGRWFYYRKSLENKLLKRLPLKNKDYMPREQTYGSHPTEEQFLMATRQYLGKLLMAANPEDKPRLMIDQLLPSSGINQCLRYFDTDVRVIIVDRDPRDIYLLSKFVWKDGIVPKDPQVFCKWFRYTHESNRDEAPNPQHVIKLQFEDMLYNYEKEKQRLEYFLGLKAEDHLRPFEGLNPQRSVHNTQLWKVYADHEAVSLIETELAEYLYDFDGISENEVAGIKVENVKRF